MTFEPNDPRSTRNPDEHQLLDLLAEVREAIDDLELGVRDRSIESHVVRGDLNVVDLLRLARRRSSRDGYPTSSLGGQGGPASVLDDRGDPMPAVSDPTGEAVVADDQDLFRHSLREVLKGVRQARADLRGSVKALVAATPPAAPPGPPGCRVLAEYGKWEPVYRAERCRWVYDWWRAWGNDPPEMIVRAKIEGRMLTPALLREAERRGALAPTSRKPEKRKPGVGRR